jgi:hypothetical protein
MAGILISGTALHFTPVQEAPTQIAEGPAKAAEQAKASSTQKPTEVLAEQVTAFLKEASDNAQGAWSELPPHNRMVMMASALASGLVGFLMGLFFPVRSAAGATAMFGAAVWLPSALWLVNAMEAPGRDYLNQGHAIGWLVVWLTLSALGFAFQTGVGSKKKAEAK